VLTDFDYEFQLVGIEPSWSSNPLVQRDDSRHPRGMATPIIISVPHQLGRAEARRRIEAGFARIINLLPGRIGARSERWDGDRLIFSVTAMGQTVSGVIHVLDAAVTMEIELPGVLRLLASGLKERLQKVGQLLLTKK
jgi:hypothetical protein